MSSLFIQPARKVKRQKSGDTLSRERESNKRIKAESFVLAFTFYPFTFAFVHQRLFQWAALCYTCRELKSGSSRVPVALAGFYRHAYFDYRRALKIKRE
jgi:hypothetical protein